MKKYAKLRIIIYNFDQYYPFILIQVTLLL